MVPSREVQHSTCLHHKSLVGVGGDNFYERSRPQGTRLNLSLSLLRTAGCRNFKGGGFRLMSDASVGEMKRKHLQAVKRDRQPEVQFTGENITIRRRNAERVFPSSRLRNYVLYCSRSSTKQRRVSRTRYILVCSVEVPCWPRWRRLEQWSLRPTFFFLTLKSQPKFISQK